MGADFAGDFRSVGFWGEVALFFPEEIKSGSDIILSDEPYLKYTLGMDYTFRGGIYLEAQFVHGFFTERGRGNLNNFLIAKIEKKYLNNELTLSLAGSLEAKDTDIEESYGTSLFPEVSYRPRDNLELTAGVYIFNWRSGTLLGSLSDQDQVTLQVKMNF